MIFDVGMEHFGPFLRGKFRSQKWEHEEYYQARSVNCSFPMERADNVVKLRTMKYQNWLTEKRPSFIYGNWSGISAALSNPELIRSFVQYESLNALGQIKADGRRRDKRYRFNIGIKGNVTSKTQIQCR